MKVRKWSKAAVMMAGAIAGALVSQAALAATIGQVSTNIGNSLKGVLDLMFMGAYIGGAICGLLAAVKLKAHNDNPQQTPMKTPVILFIVCSILVALPSFLDTAQETTWSTGGKSSADKSGGMVTR